MFLWLSTASAGMSAASSAPARPLRAVLFDIDGTLFNSDEVHLEVFAEMLAERGLRTIEMNM